jgi:hypothetical protein
VYCHDDQSSSAGHKQSGNPFRLRGKSIADGTTGLYATTTYTDVNAVCLNCHDVAANGPNGVDPDAAGSGQPKVGPATTRIGAYHAGGKHKGDNGGERCWDCHDPHGDAPNVKMIGADVLVWGDTHGFTGTRAGATVSFTAQGVGGYTDTVGPPYNGVCQVCHAATDHLGASTSMSYWLSDGSGSHNATENCIGCHTHQQPPSNAFAGAGACSACHMGATSASTSTDRDEFPPSTTTGGANGKSLIDPEDWVGTGHGRTAASGNYSQSNNPPAKFPAATQAVEPCYYCHAPDTALVGGGETSTHGGVASTNPFRLLNTGGGTNPNGVCLVCHASSAAGFDPDGGANATYANLNRTTSAAISATHYGTKHNATHDGGALCWDCHDPHGDRNYGTSRDIGYMVQLQPTIDSTNAWGSAGTFVSSANAVDFNMAKNGVATTLEGQDYVSTSTPYNGVCQVCHTNTAAPGPVKYWTAAGGGTSHMNGVRRCTSCHGHEQPPTNAFYKSYTCDACHGNGSRTKGSTVAGTVDANLIAAPPVNLLGEGATTTRGVGAHESHVNQGTFRNDALACAQCHSGWADSPQGSHIGGGAVLVGWGALATTGSVTPSWSGTTCAATYCHGNFKNGNDRVGPLPDAPTGLTFSSVANNTLTLGWTAASGAQVYKVERAPDSGGSPGAFVQIATTTSTSYADGGLWAATRYWYRVRGWNGGTDGPYSANASQLMTGGTANPPAAKTRRWQWTTSGDYAGLTANLPAPVCGDTTYPTTTTASVTSMSTVTPSCTERLYTSAGSAGSGAPLLTIVADAPYAQASAITTPSIGWQVALGSTTSTTIGTQLGYVLGGAFTGFGTVVNTTLNSTTAITTPPSISGQTGTVPAGASLAVRFTRITANSQVVRFYFSSTVGAVTVTEPVPATPPALPTAPTGTPTLTLGTSTSDTMAMSWTTVTNATSYKVERSPDGTSGWVQVGQPTTLTFTDSGLSPSTPYWYRVKASNAGGDAPSYSASQTKSTAAVTAPAGVTWAGTYTSGSTTLTCMSCHGNPPGGTHPAGDNCSLCHPSYSDKSAVPQTVVKTQHLDGTVNLETDCTKCHSVKIGARRPIVAEFGMTWSHKHNAAGAVTKWDCMVCHMEGNPTTGLPDAAFHMNGLLNLRDPDTGANIQNVAFSGGTDGQASPGSYGPASGDATFASFSRDLSKTLENDPNKAALQAVMVNLCLHCHDDDGAASTLARVPTAVMPNASAGKPFGTTIAAGQGTYTGASGNTACDGTPNPVADGCVTNIAASFNTGNSSYHPVLGRQNNWYAKDTRLKAPYDEGVTTRSGTVSVTNWGTLLSCWDCHAPPGVTSLTKTVTAHGGSAAEYMRGNPVAVGIPTSSTGSTLCWVCHAGYDTASSAPFHNTGSAWTTTDANSGMQDWTQWGCNACHSSGYNTTAVVLRPVRAQDIHGVNVLPAGTKTTRWSGVSTGTPAQVEARPYAFIRNTSVLSNHSPAKIGGSTYTPNCTHATTGYGECTGEGSKTPGVGGTY